jgi:hypothetical protein
MSKDPLKSLKKCLVMLSSPSYLKDFQSLSPKTLSLTDLPDLIMELSIFLNNDCEQAFSLFTTSENPFFEDDTLNPSSFTFSQFTKRISYFLMYQYYMVHGFENGLEALKNYLLGKPIDETPKYNYKPPEEIEENAENHEVFEDFTERAGIRNPFVLEILKENSEIMRSVFDVYCEDGKVDVRKCAIALNEIFMACMWKIVESEVNRFQRLVFLYFPVREVQDYYYKLLDDEHIAELDKLGLDYKVFYPKITFYQFLLVFEAWIDSKYPQSEFQEKILEDLEYYTKDSKGMLTETFQTIVKGLENAYIQSLQAENLKDPNKYEIENINNIYKKYNKPLSLKFFIDFLVDYEILGNPTEKYRFIKKKQAKTVYTRICLNCMSQPQFLVTIT